MITEYGNLLYNFGLADENEAEYIRSMINTAVKYIQDGKYREALVDVK